MRIAAPQMGDSIAPCFEAATAFWIADVADGKVVSERTVTCPGAEGFRRARLLRVHDVAVLICNGIKAHYVNILRASGMEVISKVTGSLGEAVQSYLSGRLPACNSGAEETPLESDMQHNDLVAWARRLFSDHGYLVKAGPGEDAFLVDLVAEMECPVCHRPVRVAICCGAHTYRPTLEIAEFHHSTPDRYHARVYVCPANPTSIKCCRAYGIQLIDPVTTMANPDWPETSKIPLLHQPVSGHEEALV